MPVKARVLIEIHTKTNHVIYTHNLNWLMFCNIIKLLTLDNTLHIAMVETVINSYGCSFVITLMVVAV